VIGFSDFHVVAVDFDDTVDNGFVCEAIENVDLDVHDVIRLICC
jgi:hypothetical protein